MVKADGLAAGKGVVVAQSVAQAEAAVDDMLVDRKFGEAGARTLFASVPPQASHQSLRVCSAGHSACMHKGGFLLLSGRDIG